MFLNDNHPVSAPAAVSALSSMTLASVLDQSVDCVKLLGMDGTLRYMNGNGLCAMEIDDFCAVEGQRWASLWPPEARAQIDASYARADAGETVRFRAFCPTAKGDPRWWDVSVTAVRGEGTGQVGYLSISRDVTEAETARETLEVAAAELKHRLANTYAMISGLLAGFARGDPANERFADDMRNRLAALGQAQALFANKDAPCAIGQLIPALLAPFERPSCDIAVSGLITAEVNQGQADAIALVLGELAVNSSKHGALAHGGEIAVNTSTGDDSTVVEWIERSDQPVRARSREGGQGLSLMNRIVRARRGTITFDWNDFGLTVTLIFRNN